MRPTAAFLVAAIALLSQAAGNSPFLLTHPLPGFDTGMGFCADGFCFSAQSQRRVIYRGGDRTKQHDAANYAAREEPRR